MAKRGRKPQPIPDEKECSDCHAIKKIEDFYKRSDRRCYQSYCKKCSHKRSVKRSAARYKVDPDFRKMQIVKMAKWRKLNRERYNDRVRPAVKKHQKKQRELITDNWIRHVLVQRTNLKRKDFPQEIIDMQRIKIVAKRIVRKYEKQT